MLGSRPLYDNRADAALFVPPAAWNAAARAVERKLNVLVVGGRGAGKTTLLRQMQFRLRNEGKPVAFVDASAVEEVEDLVARVRDEVVEVRPPLETGLETLAATLGGEPVAAGASRLLSRVLREIGDAAPATILVDATASGGVIYALFGRLRDALWQQDHRWIVAIDQTDSATVLKPPADAFFDVVLELEPLSPERLMDILNRRLDEADADLAQFVATSAVNADGNPRKAIRALSDAVVHRRDPAETLEARARLVSRAAELGRSAGMVMAELLDRGQASPSDKDLQASLGVTRSRLVQILRELNANRLVVAETERPEGPGRPRTVYRPALPR